MLKFEYNYNYGMTLDDIKVLLDEAGMTFNELAEKMGKERSVVYKTIQNGNPTLSFLIKLSDALGKSIDDIVKLPERKSEHEEETKQRMIQINGFVEANGHIHKLSSIDDLKRVIDSIEK